MTTQALPAKFISVIYLYATTKKKVTNLFHYTNDLTKLFRVHIKLI